MYLQIHINIYIVLLLLNMYIYIYTNIYDGWELICWGMVGIIRGFTLTYLRSFPFYISDDLTEEQRLAVGREFWVLELLLTFPVISQNRREVLVSVQGRHVYCGGDVIMCGGDVIMGGGLTS